MPSILTTVFKPNSKFTRPVMAELGGDGRKSHIRTALWLALCLVVLLLSIALLLLLAHSPTSSSADSSLSHLHGLAQMPSVQLLDQQPPFAEPEPADLLISGHASDPSQKSALPLASNPAMFNETGWSSYRPQLYFGLKNRRPDSPLFGIMWYRQKTVKTTEKLPLRHWAMHEDDVVFMWNHHDGRGFGSQKLTDGDFGMRTDFFNFGTSSWMARLYMKRQEWSEEQALVLYFALQDKLSRLEPNAIEAGPGGEIQIVQGQSEAVHGNFSLKVRPISTDSNLSFSELIVHGEPFVDMAHVGDLVKSALKLQIDGNFAFGQRPAEKDSNLVALQINVKADSVLEVLFQAEEDVPPPHFDEAFRKKEESFRINFNRAFPIPKNFSAIYHKMGHAAISNLLGGIGVWHGNCWMHSKQFTPTDSVKSYGPLSLMSAVPSRTGFPRGFIWDEGFHNMLIHKWDPLLSIQILGSYLDLMNVDGWIPREVVIGSEAEARIPGNFLVQDDWVANPPMFFYLMRDMLENKEIVRQFGTELKRLYPRMKKLYLWLHESQRGLVPGTFRWHDRNQTTNLELNPCTLSSGLDDYPRATHPTDQEYHLDIRCWMAMSSSVLTLLAEITGDELFLPKIRKETEMLMNVDALDRFHWSEKAQRYCDFGLHSEAVELVTEKTPQGEEVLVRKVLKEPHYGFVENVNGYANLFPMLLRLLPANSPRLGPMLKQIADPQEFWTPFESSPYWRGPIWINMNYFAVVALKHYASLEGPYREDCARMHDELRENLLSNVADQYEKTGFLWEHYDDIDGHGAGNHPFTGWTTLILKIMTDNY